MSSVHAPADWRGKFVAFTDVLLFLREYAIKKQSLLVFVGSHDVERFRSFEAGIGAYQFLCGASDRTGSLFTEWLRLRHGLSSDGWAPRFLAKAGGDHFAAIMMYLDECAAYCAATASATAGVLERLRRHGPGGIPFKDARRLLLALWVTLDVLPPGLRAAKLDRENLARIFSTLGNEGVVGASGDVQERSSYEFWLRLPDVLLSGKEELDQTFWERAREYLRE
jgi:hypothetical protein